MTEYVIRDESGHEHYRTDDEERAYDLRDEHERKYNSLFYVHEE